MNELEQLRAENAKLIRAAEIFMACHEEMSGAITKITGHFNADGTMKGDRAAELFALAKQADAAANKACELLQGIE